MGPTRDCRNLGTVVLSIHGVDRVLVVLCWYRQGLTALLSDPSMSSQRSPGPPQTARPHKKQCLVLDYDAAWRILQQTTEEQLGFWSISAPRAPGQPTNISYVLTTAAQTYCIQHKNN